MSSGLCTKQVIIRMLGTFNQHLPMILSNNYNPGCLCCRIDSLCLLRILPSFLTKQAKIALDSYRTTVKQLSVKSLPLFSNIKTFSLLELPLIGIISEKAAIYSKGINPFH